jgi:hypothetical protein
MCVLQSEMLQANSIQNQIKDRPQATSAPPENGCFRCLGYSTGRRGKGCVTITSSLVFGMQGKDWRTMLEDKFLETLFYCMKNVKNCM